MPEKPTLLFPDGSSVELTETFSIGRHKDNVLVIRDSEISRQHALIRWQSGEGPNDNGAYYVVDLGSSNGTWINQRRVKWQVLRDGDLFDIGPLRFEFVDKPVEIEDEQSMDGADE